MIKVGWIGAGSMGNAIVSKLLADGILVHIYNRTKANAEILVDKGALWADSPKEIALECKFIFLCLGSAEATDDVMWNLEDCLSRQLDASHVVIDLSTTSPEQAICLASRLKKDTMAEYLECPVSGGVEGALSGSLAAIVAGSIDAFERCRNILNIFIKTVTFVEHRGRAQQLKILNNLAESINLCGALEVLYIARSLGFTVSEMERVFMSCRASSAYMKVALNYLKSECGSTGVSLNVRCKDLSLASSEADLSKYPMAQSATSILFRTRELIGDQGDQCDYFKLIS